MLDHGTLAKSAGPAQETLKAADFGAARSRLHCEAAVPAAAAIHKPLLDTGH